MHHISLDIQTLDANNRAVVLSLGAVSFSPFNTGSYHSAHERFNIQQQLETGRSIGVGTLLRWLEQEQPICKEALTSPRSVEAGLATFTAFVAHCREAVSDLDFCCWAKSPHFVATVLASLYSDAGLECPIKFHEWMDVQTAMRMAPDATWVHEGTKHSSLSNAKTQARCVQEVYSALGVQPPVSF